MTAAQLSIAFFLQMAIIVGISRVVGSIAHRYFGQPQVVGEMIAGVILGPTLFGALMPEAQAWLFPSESRKLLYVGAQLGVGLYMFLVGLGFDRDAFRANAGPAAWVSIAGMLVPFGCAMLLAPYLMQVPGLFQAHVSQMQATFFLGAAIAITAFPMLARIIHERGISGSRLGTLSLSAGAIDDVSAWVVIAIVLATLGEGPMVAIKAVGGGLGFAAFMLLLAPRLLVPLERAVQKAGGLTDGLFALAILLFLLSAWAMDAAGIHAVFGGFLLGTAMPRGRLVTELKARLEPFTVVFLLPMFFTFSGLNTQLLLVNNWDLALVALVVLVVSILAKGGACYAAARFSGQDHATAMGIGALMNARGLMELIIINIGLQRGIIGPALFAMLVVMAIVTTLMASPVFEAVYGKAARARGEL
jgi:Kef-type K+ transport system membrane component KefB